MTPAELKALDAKLGVALCTLAQNGRGDSVWAMTRARKALPALIRLWEAAENINDCMNQRGASYCCDKCGRELESALRELREMKL